jgi:hypothetical protein
LSAPGWDLTVGTWCLCGPYSRGSGYYPTLEAAEATLEAGATGGPDHLPPEERERQAELRALSEPLGDFMAEAPAAAPPGTLAVR